ncbi:MAG: hypothetical protein AAGG01_00245 [Planctomycetota bacterium]
MTIPPTLIHLGASIAAIDLPALTSGTLYLTCAAAGGAVLAVQMLLLFLGGDVADGEVDLDVDSDGLSFFSIRAIAAFLTFFGLVGLYGQNQGWSDALTAGSALGAGSGMMLAVAWLFSLQSKLHQEGNVKPADAVGKPAVVYLRIPAAGEGKGKITVAMQGRTVEFAAVTSGPELPTGTDVTIQSMINETTFEVAKS